MVFVFWSFFVGTRQENTSTATTLWYEHTALHNTHSNLESTPATAATVPCSLHTPGTGNVFWWPLASHQENRSTVHAYGAQFLAKQTSKGSTLSLIHI